jgi:hypothetical protein
MCVCVWLKRLYPYLLALRNVDLAGQIGGRGTGNRRRSLEKYDERGLCAGLCDSAARDRLADGQNHEFSSHMLGDLRTGASEQFVRIYQSVFSGYDIRLLWR